MTAEADSLTTDAKQLLEDCAWWDATQKKDAILCQSTQELTPQDMFDSCGNQMKRKTRAHMQRSLRWSLAKKGGRIITDSRERTADTLFSWNLLHLSLKAVTSEVYSKHQGKTICDQIRSSKITLLCMPSPSWTDDDCVWICSENLQSGTLKSVQPLMSMSLCDSI